MLPIKSTFVFLCFLLVLCYGQQPASCPNQGDGNYGCFEITSQGSCIEVTSEPPANDERWPHAGLDANVDWALKCGHIVAYKLQWFNGIWSPWYVPGVNDMDQKVNDKNGQRRMWSYFHDHTHSYIICKPNNKNPLNGCR